MSLDDAWEDSRATELSQITRAMVAIYKDQFGRGPRNAHSHWTGRDAVACFLEGSLTPVERTLASIGEHQRLRGLRLLFQHAAAPEFRAAIESITGRRVLAFMSGMDTSADVATEVFVLESTDERSER
ncbi:MAG: DUF2294 domain-containing protein [Gaiellales bacterium]